jgi:nucleotide-binding universal stress UspA family protein
VHAYQLPSVGWDMPSEELSAAAQKAALRVTADALSQVSLPAGLVVDTGAELNTPVLMLQRLSDHVAMVVLGQHASDPSDTRGAASGASSLVAAASCPVVLVPRGWGRNRGQARLLVVGLDRESAVEEVLRFAFAEVERRGWPLIVIRAVCDEDGSAGCPPEVAKLEELLAEHERDRADPPVAAVLVPGDLASVLEHSRRAGLLVLGRPLPPSAPGSDPRSFGGRVLTSAACPVAIVPQLPTCPAAA